MQKHMIVGVLVLVLILGGAWFVMSENGMSEEVMTKPESTVPSAPPAPGVSVTIPDPNAPQPPAVKEFMMDSWMEKSADGTMSAHFSLAEMSVKKGDKVRVTINNTKGTHDFVIDEFGVKTETPEGVPTLVEFTADKVGDFEYYCSKYNHRSLGQKGMLHVTE